MSDPREAEVEVLFISGLEYHRGTNHYALRMSRLEFDALKLRAAQQEKAADSHDSRDYTFTLGGNVYTHEYLMWLLSTNHRSGPIPTQQQWAEAKIRQQEAQEEKRRRAQEEARRAQEAYFQEAYFRASRQGSPGFTRARFFGPNDPFSRGFHEQPKDSKATQNKKLLAKMAGVEWDEADNMKLEVLKKRAMRNCHPDTGGSHEKWLEFTQLLKVMDIKL